MHKDKVILAIISVLCVGWLCWYSTPQVLLTVLILSIWFQPNIASFFTTSSGPLETTTKEKRRDTGSSLKETQTLLNSFKRMLKSYPSIMGNYKSYIQKLIKEVESPVVLSSTDFILLSSEYENIFHELDISLLGSNSKAYSKWMTIDVQVRHVLKILQYRINNSDGKRREMNQIPVMYPSNSYQEKSFFTR
jgi:hypothetical protein